MFLENLKLERLSYLQVRMIGIPTLLATKGTQPSLLNSAAFQRDLNALESNADLSPSELLRGVIALVKSFYQVVPKRASASSSSPFYSLPCELSLSIFFHLDLKNLLVVMSTCSLWNQLFAKFSETLYRNLLMRDYKIGRNREMSFFESYRLSFNIKREKYIFSALEDTRGSPGDEIVASWPVAPNQAVLNRSTNLLVHGRSLP